MKTSDGRREIIGVVKHPDGWWFQCSDGSFMSGAAPCAKYILAVERGLTCELLRGNIKWLTNEICRELSTGLWEILCLFNYIIRHVRCFVRKHLDSWLKRGNTLRLGADGDD